MMESARQVGEGEIIAGKGVMLKCECLSDFYIVSKKFKWLINEDHEEIVYFVGDEIDISLIGSAK